ncbi:YdiK family protein [Desemzia sp. RIT804]|uniref:YdiK family protein n=1 Tax=Desemzia sp. RIT 804 TaxID=2810209 RepID=UPI00194E9F7B|nr:YdiK family protein [Desemzia sp. RIT 804]MBM6615553.1 YdiK family protein [Desemzia sp. RIT 804]
MKKSDFIIQIVFNYILAAVFIWFAIDYVNEFGWGFFSIISVLFATRDIVKGTRILQIYLKLKKGSKP